MAEKKTDKLAGLIPYRVKEDGEVKMMFMRPNEPNKDFNPGDKYEIAKGWVDEGEDIEQAAIREAKEELGLFRGNIIDIHQLGVFPLDLHVFIAKIKEKDQFGEFTEETEKTKWLTEEEFEEKGIKMQVYVVKSALRKINKLEKKDVSSTKTTSG